MSECPNVLPDAECVDPACSCRLPTKLTGWPDVESETRWHWCPGCERLHPIPPDWRRTGQDAAPTYSPSFLQGTSRGPCHYFILEGRLIFQSDCFHDLKNETVAMPDIPANVMANLTNAIFER